MVLVPSCSGIYFPDPPMDNILTLTWQCNEDESPGAYSCMVYKVKSSAPQLFYVIPRYGALLVSDASAKLMRPCAVNVTFGLRPTAVDAPAEMDASTQPQQRPYSSPVALSGGNHQKRFAIEYLLITGDRTTYERVARVLATDGGLTDVVRDVWEHIVPNAPRNTPIHLKVFISGVTMDGRRGESGMTVVPPEAQLIRPSLQEYMRRHSPSASLARESNTAPSVSRLSEQSRSVNTSELHTAQLGTDSSRHEYATTGASSGVSSGIFSRSVGMSSGHPNDANTGSRIAKGLHSPPGNIGVDIIMRIPKGEDGFNKKKNNGLPLIVVVAGMFSTYVISMLLWRGHSGDRNSIGVGQL